MEQLSLPYAGAPPHQVGSETSEEAAQSIAADTVSIQRKVLAFIRDQGWFGATCDEVEASLGLRHQTASARCCELVLLGLIERRQHPATGKWCRRRTRSGRKADVLYACEPPPPEESIQNPV